MLLSNRIDAFIGDKYVIGWEEKRESIDISKTKINKCLESHPFYFALNSNTPWNQELINLLNTQLSKAKNKVILSSIIKRYTSQ